MVTLPARLAGRWINRWTVLYLLATAKPSASRTIDDLLQNGGLAKTQQTFKKRRRGIGAVEPPAAETRRRVREGVNLTRRRATVDAALAEPAPPPSRARRQDAGNLNFRTPTDLERG